MLLSAGSIRHLTGSDQAPLTFSVPERSNRFPFRRLLLAGETSFELSSWCGTCPFVFERKEGANQRPSEVCEALTGLSETVEVIDDDLLAAISPTVPAGDYLPLLLEVKPELVAPGDSRDYFAHEEVDTWGVNAFWGLPENPRSFYYRTFETPVQPDDHLYEFVVPMVPPSWNERDRVEHYEVMLNDGGAPAALALSVLDICQPVMLRGPDSYQHWGLTHFLLDGHHKMEAAARSGIPVRLLTLVSVDWSLARAEDIERLPGLLSQSQSRRRG